MADPGRDPSVCARVDHPHHRSENFARQRRSRSVSREPNGHVTSARGDLDEGVSCSVTTRAASRRRASPCQRGDGSLLLLGDMLLERSSPAPSRSGRATPSNPDRRGTVTARATSTSAGTLASEARRSLGDSRASTSTPKGHETARHPAQAHERYCVVLQTLATSPR